MQTTEIQTPSGAKYTVKTNCRKCYGRGYTGTDKFTGKQYPCTCIRRVKEPDKKEETPEVKDEVKEFLDVVSNVK